MIIAVPKETFPLEKRVMVLPSSVNKIVSAGHVVRVQVGAGIEIRVSDADYEKMGAQMVTEAQDLYSGANMIVKLKAPNPHEFSLMENAILFCMLHSEQNTERIYHLGDRKLVAIEMEKIRNKKNQRVIDQTDITGESGVYYALRHFDKMPYDINAIVLGYGNVSSGAIKALGKLGANIKILRKSEFKYIEQYLDECDLLVNGISWPKIKRDAKAYLVTREMIQKSKPGMVVLDLAVDFPGVIETSKPTDYVNTYYLEEGHVHIGIYGYPGLVPVTSSRVYDQQVLPITLLIANNNGLENIKKAGDLGEAVSKAILDPEKIDWQSLNPSQKTESPIE